MRSSIRTFLAALAFFPASPLFAARFISVPTTDVLSEGRVSLWHFALFEERSTRTWRQLNRLDLGLKEGWEVGLLNIRPKDKPSDTWINVQWKPLKEEGWRPAVSVGVWDAFRRGSFFSDEKAGPSPFVIVGKGIVKGSRHLKGSAGYGFTRLRGPFGGVELKFLRRTGLQAEYAPPNLRLAGTEAWDVGLHQWFGERVRARASWMGGNPMVDIFVTWSLGAGR